MSSWIRLGAASNRAYAILLVASLKRQYEHRAGSIEFGFAEEYGCYAIKYKTKESLTPAEKNAIEWYVVGYLNALRETAE